MRYKQIRSDKPSLWVNSNLVELHIVYPNGKVEVLTYFSDTWEESIWSTPGRKVLRRFIAGGSPDAEFVGYL